MSDPGYKIRTGLHASGKLPRDYLAGDKKALKYFASDYENISSYVEKANLIEKYMDRESIVEILSNHPYTENVAGYKSKLDEFLLKGGYVVVTGQQPVICGGPMFIIYKALTAIKLAKQLERKLGVPVLPVFWVAGDDHDFEEIAGLSVPDKDDQLQTISLLERDSELNVSACLTFLENSDIDEIFRLGSFLPDTEQAKAIVDKLKSSYRDKQSIDHAFSEFISSIFSKYGLFVVNSCNQQIKESASEVLRREILEWQELYEAYKSVSAGLQDDGYAIQVNRDERETNLFMIEENGFRDKIIISQDGYRLKKSGREIDKSTLMDLITYEPRRISAGVLARPLVEAKVFCTLAYIAGPGEISYYAQMKELYSVHELEMPVICPRFGGMIVETKISHLLDKLSLNVNSLKLNTEVVASMVARKEEPLNKIIDNLNAMKKELDTGIQSIMELVGDVDPTMEPVAAKSGNYIDRRIERLERRIVAAYKNKHSILRNQIDRIKNHLGVENYPQERRTGFIYYLAKFGDGFIDNLLDEIEPLDI